MADSDISVFIIEELPQPGFAGSKLELRGGGLPKTGATWGGKQLVITKWYVGNPVATQQSLGSRENPSTFEGMWRRNLLEQSPAIWTDEFGNRNEVVHPHILMQLVDDIRTRGYPLRVMWTAKPSDSADVQVIREGRLTDCEFPIDRAEDIGWKMTFDWKSRGLPETLATNFRDPLASNENAALQLKINDCLVKIAALKNKLGPDQYGSTTSFGLDQLAKLASYPTDIMEGLTTQFNSILVKLSDVEQLAQQIALTPAQVADMTLSICNSTLALCNQSVLDTMNIPAEYAQVDKGTAADAARNANYLAGVTDSVTQVEIKTLEIIRALLRQKASQSPVDASGAVVGDAGDTALSNTLYKVKAGDTAISISIQFYGSPDYAGAVLKANRLSPYTVDLDVGSIIVVPTNPKAIS